MEKKHYASPLLELLNLEKQDILTVSGVVENDPVGGVSEDDFPVIWR